MAFCHNLQTTVPSLPLSRPPLFLPGKLSLGERCPFIEGPASVLYTLHQFPRRRNTIRFSYLRAFRDLRTWRAFSRLFHVRRPDVNGSQPSNSIVRFCTTVTRFVLPELTTSDLIFRIFVLSRDGDWRFSRQWNWIKLELTKELISDSW